MSQETEIQHEHEWCVNCHGSFHTEHCLVEGCNATRDTECQCGIFANYESD